MRGAHRDDTAFSFNGGKDSTVLLHLIRAALAQRQALVDAQPDCTTAAVSAGPSSAGSAAFTRPSAAAAAVHFSPDSRDQQTTRGDAAGSSGGAEPVVNGTNSSAAEVADAAAAVAVAAAVGSQHGGNPCITRIRTFVFHRPDDFQVRCFIGKQTGQKVLYYMCISVESQSALFLIT